VCAVTPAGAQSAAAASSAQPRTETVDAWTQDAPVVRSRSRENRRTSFSTASGIQAPATHPVVQYCPGFEMGVPPVEVREPGTAVSGDAAK
jgi:hypothetical protein